MKPARIAVICVAAVAAVGLALVVRTMGSGQPTAVAAAGAADARVMAKVLVAARDLQPGQRLTDADLEWKSWPVDEVNPLFITDGTVPLPEPPAPKDAAPSEKDEPAKADAKADKKTGKKPGEASRLVRAAADFAKGGAKGDYFGSVVREPILAGEPIVGRKIVRAGDSGYMAAYLEPGMRAMAIRVTVETAAGGFILPGDRVDVILTREVSAGGDKARNRYASTTVMRNVKVLAIDQSTRADDEEQAVIGATATLELSPMDAEGLSLARSEGELSLVLRSYADTSGPSGGVGRPATVEAAAVRIFRGGPAETVLVQ